MRWRCCCDDIAADISDIRDLVDSHAMLMTKLIYLLALPFGEHTWHYRLASALLNSSQAWPHRQPPGRAAWVRRGHLVAAEGRGWRRRGMAERRSDRDGDRDSDTNTSKDRNRDKDEDMDRSQRAILLWSELSQTRRQRQRQREEILRLFSQTS